MEAPQVAWSRSACSVRSPGARSCERLPTEGREIQLLQGAVRSHQPSGRPPEENASRFPGLIWLLSLLICALVVAVAFVRLDVPIARSVFGALGPTENLAKGLTSAVLLSAEAAVALTLIVIRITRGRLSPSGEAAALACLTSICAYSMNDGALKFLFGVPNPSAVIHGARHALNLLSGSSSSTFPSGHMVLSGAFAGVFMRLYRRSILPLSALLFVGAVLLVVGDWHFLSDVIAGTFIGVSAGLLAGEVWSAHSSRMLRSR
jgi:membrane-associated phospholipid phosphatase